MFLQRKIKKMRKNQKNRKKYYVCIILIANEILFMRKLIVLGSLGFILLTSCAPSITTKVLERQEALGENQKVTVYNHKEQVPEGSKVLGRINVEEEAAITTNCDSLKMITKIKKESRKIGGNAFLITEHKRPSTLGSSCHQFKGVILSVPLGEQAEEENDDLEAVVLSLNKQHLLPRLGFSAGFGPSWRTDKLASGLNDFTRHFYKNLLSGFEWNVSADCFFNDFFGIRFLYQRFSSSYSQFVSDGFVSGSLDGSGVINTVMPASVVRFSSPKQKWLFDLSLGIGYIDLKEEFNFPDKTFSRITGYSVGARGGVGIEYRFIENLGIAFELVSTSGALSRVKINDNGVIETIDFGDDYREGLNHISLQFGLKYHF
jgi:hypothetical protein